MKVPEAGIHLVLMPGLDGTGILFEPFVRTLPGGVNCTIVTYPPERRLSKAELVEVALEQVPRDRDVVLVAESFSGPIAAELLRRNLPSVKAVVFVASFLESPRPFLLTVARLLPLSWLFRVPVPGFLIRRLSLGPAASDSLIALFRRARRAVHPRALAERLRIIARLKRPADRIRVPALYLQATRDRLVPARCVSAFRSAGPHIEVVRIDGPHLVLQANPGECLQAMRGIIGR